MQAGAPSTEPRQPGLVVCLEEHSTVVKECVVLGLWRRNQLKAFVVFQVRQDRSSWIMVTAVERERGR